jgi:hypothetical protein
VSWRDSDEFFTSEIAGANYLEFTIEDGLLRNLKMIEPVMLEVIRGDVTLFWSSVCRDRGLVFRSTPTGKLVLAILIRGQAEFNYYFPMHDLNPYVALLFKCADKINRPLLISNPVNVAPCDVLEFVKMMNYLIEDIRVESSSSEFKRLVNRFSKAEIKRAASLDGYINAIFERNARVVVIRLDLSYGAELFNGKDLQEKLYAVKKDWANMQRDLHKGIPIRGMLGFACKLEYGQLKGFHFHLLVFYDGSIYRKDVVLARLIGEHWVNAVTKGGGRYFNCNNKKWQYLYRGVGVINHLDTVLIDNLKKRIAAYLTKVDYWVRFTSASGRSFFRGNMPSAGGIKRGRPRRIADSEIFNQSL